VYVLIEINIPLSNRHISRLGVVSLFLLYSSRFKAGVRAAPTELKWDMGFYLYTGRLWEAWNVLTRSNASPVRDDLFIAGKIILH